MRYRASVGQHRFPPCSREALCVGYASPPVNANHTFMHQSIQPTTVAVSRNDTQSIICCACDVFACKNCV